MIGDWLYEHFEAYVPDPDRDGYRAVRAPKMKHTPPDPQQVSKNKIRSHRTTSAFRHFSMFHDMFGLRRVQGTKNEIWYGICFTICLFISPDLDGHRALKMKFCPTETHKRSLNPNTKPPRYVRIEV